MVLFHFRWNSSLVETSCMLLFHFTRFGANTVTVTDIVRIIKGKKKSLA
jgi:hypothetical protein